MNSLLKNYRNILSKHPILTQAFQTGLLMGSGDLIAQVFIEKNQNKTVSTVRVVQFFFVGIAFVGPTISIWYKTLDRKLGRIGKFAALKKTAADQLIFAPPFIFAFIIVVGLIQFKSQEEIGKRVREDYFDILRNNYKVWPAVQLVNFYFTPLQYQVLFVQIIAVFWNCYLSYKVNRIMP